MSDLDKLFDAALKKPTASAVTESGAIVELPETTTEVTPVTPVTAADAPQPQGKGGHAYPWDDANPRVKCYFQIRMPETLKRKIEWLEIQHMMRGERGKSGKGMQHEIALAALEREIDRIVAKELKAK